MLDISFNFRIIVYMQYLRNIIFLIIIFVFNAEYANAQINRDEIRVGQDKILTNSYDDIIVNAKDYTLQNIDKVQNIVENLDYPTVFNFKQLSLNSYYDTDEEEYSVTIKSQQDAEKLNDILEEYYQMIINVEDYRITRQSLLNRYGFLNDNTLFNHLISKNLSDKIYNKFEKLSNNLSDKERNIVKKYKNGSVLNYNEQQLLTETLSNHPN